MGEGEGEGGGRHKTCDDLKKKQAILMVGIKILKLKAFSLFEINCISLLTKSDF